MCTIFNIAYCESVHRHIDFVYLHLLIPTLELPTNHGSTKKMHRKVVAFFKPAKRTFSSFQSESLEMLTYLPATKDYHVVVNLEKEKNEVECD